MYLCTISTINGLKHVKKPTEENFWPHITALYTMNIYCLQFLGKPSQVPFSWRYIHVYTGLIHILANAELLSKALVQ